jgi:hypothetical protein
LYITVFKEWPLSITVNWEDKANGPHTVTVWKDITPPDPVDGEKLEGKADSDTEITLTWTNPKDKDFDHVLIGDLPDGASESQTIDSEAGTGTSVISGLTADTEYTFTVTAVDKDGNPSAAVNKTVRTLERPKASVTVSFSGFEDEEVKSTGDGATLSWKDPESKLTVTLSGIEGFYSCKWSLDGGSLQDVENGTVERKADTFSVKNHTLTIFVTKEPGDVPYTKRLTFTVGE